jgi:hypothetical protein
MKLSVKVSMTLSFFVVLIFAGGCATGKKVIYVEDALELRSGEWINEDYRSDQLTVFRPDGRYEVYDTPQKSQLIFSGTSKIYESWRDSEGVLWYRAHYEDSVGQEGYVLGKMSDSDQTLEFIFTTDNVVIEEWKIGKVGYNYVVYYRR